MVSPQLIIRNKVGFDKQLSKCKYRIAVVLSRWHFSPSYLKYWDFEQIKRKTDRRQFLKTLKENQKEIISGAPLKTKITQKINPIPLFYMFTFNIIRLA
jgi:hypothetical protein